MPPKPLFQNLIILEVCWLNLKLKLELFSYLSGETVRFNSVVTALAVMYAAEKYLVSRITRLALRFINKNATSENVLMILQHLYVLHQRTSEDEEGHFAPSAPPLEVLEQDLGGFFSSNNNNYRPDLDKERRHKSHTKLTSHSFEKNDILLFENNSKVCLQRINW